MTLIGDEGSFGALLKSLRKREHLTQHQLVEALGIHRSTLIRWEQGDSLPGSKALVLELARFLHLDHQETRQLLEASLTALAPYWCVPLPRNPYFTGREAILEELHAQLRPDQVVALTPSSALSGLGGVGKTQTALEYAYRSAFDYSAVFWVRAETPEQILASFRQMAETLQLSDRRNNEQEALVAAVKRWLATHGQWLLIWDNLDDRALLEQFVPPVRSGAILVTTQLQVLGTRAHRLDLFPMAEEEGLLFLLRRAKVLAPQAPQTDLDRFANQTPADYAAAQEVVALLGGLPLALDQAGAYLEETHCGLPAYLNLFRTRQAALLQQRGEGARDHPASVSTTLRLSIAATAERHPAVQALLQVCALLQPDVIPEELFRLGADHLVPQLQSACCDPLEWDLLVAAACSHSLLCRQPADQTLSLHRLVQAVVLDTMPPAEQEQWRRRIIGALNFVFPDVWGTSEPTHWKQGERFLPHALLCLSSPEPDDDLLPLASLAVKVSGYLHKRGRYAEAERLCRHALHLRERVLGPDHPEVASSVHALAIACWKQGKIAEAERLSRRLLRLQEHALGPEHPDVAVAFNDLAIILTEQGEDQEAEQLYLRAWHLWERTLGPEHALVGTALNNLAELYGTQGRYSEAEALYLQALNVYQHALGSEHPDVAHPLSGLAGVYAAQGNDEQAEHLYQRALCLREQHLGPAHPETARTLHDFALLRRQQGKLNEARSLAEQALRTCVQSLGATHPQALTAQALSTALLQDQPEGEAEAATAHGFDGLAKLNRDKRAESGSALSRHQASPSASRTADPFQIFLTACCERHPRAWCRSADLWQAYEQWARDHQERYPLSRASFTQQLKAHGCRADRTKATRIWRGIALARTRDDGG